MLIFEVLHALNSKRSLDRLTESAIYRKHGQNLKLSSQIFEKVVGNGASK